MNKYYGLRLARTFFIAASVVVSISIIATIGALGGLAIVSGEEFNVIQAFMALIMGGLIALISYAFGQLIDVNIKNYEVSYRLLEQIEESNKLNQKTVYLLSKQLRIMHTEYNLEEDIDIKKIEKQLDARRNNLVDHKK